MPKRPLCHRRNIGHTVRKSIKDGEKMKRNGNFAKLKMEEQTMTKEEIVASANIFAELQRVLKKDKAADVQNAAIFPIKMMILYNKEAFARHVLTEETQVYLASQYDAFTLDDFNEWMDKPLSLPEQGIWQLAYSKAKHK